MKAGETDVQDGMCLKRSRSAGLRGRPPGLGGWGEGGWDNTKPVRESCWLAKKSRCIFSAVGAGEGA